MNMVFKSYRVRIALSAVISLLAVLALSRLRLRMPRHDEEPRPSVNDVPGVPIFEGVSVTQEFPARDDDITSIALKLATYARENPGTLKIELAKRSQGEWLPLTTATFAKRLLTDNADQVFSFPRPLKVRKGDELALTLTADGPASSAITWRLFSELELPNHGLHVGDQSHPGTAAFKVSYRGAVGRAGGPNMRGRLWKRITIFLHTPGRILLIAGFLLALFSTICLMLAPVPDRASPDKD